MLALTTSEAIALVGLILSLLTVVLIPTIKWMRKKIVKYKKDMQQIQDNKKSAENNTAMIQKIDEKLEIMIENQINLEETLADYLEDYGEFTIQNLKYMINDAFFGYNNIHDIPDDVLLNACECCEIYVNKRHHNHEIKPRCKMLWDELERRSVHREVTHE